MDGETGSRGTGDWKVALAWLSENNAAGLRDSKGDGLVGEPIAPHALTAWGSSEYVTDTNNQLARETAVRMTALLAQRMYTEDFSGLTQDEVENLALASLDLPEGDLSFHWHEMGDQGDLMALLVRCWVSSELGLNFSDPRHIGVEYRKEPSDDPFSCAIGRVARLAVSQAKLNGIALDMEQAVLLAVSSMSCIDDRPFVWKEV